ncbi:MAG: PAS domain-containing protein, partial [Gemmobacter sp.]|nr:PAS domain-containing protein [Gemmobacter sp.]
MTTDPKTKAAWNTLSGLETLDVLSNPVMIADKAMIIRYVNEAAYKMFEAIEADIRRDLPHFEARKVIGKNVDLFHKNPAYQRRLMGDMRGPHDGKFTIGGKSLIFRATPVLQPDGEASCVYVEWQDLTAAVAGKAQIDRMIHEIKA